ncbi:hypothetical protein MCEGE10_01841 [Flavobacteriaceae bacterium]
MIFHFESSFENVTGKKQSRSFGSDFLPLIPAKNRLKDGFATFNFQHIYFDLNSKILR